MALNKFTRSPHSPSPIYGDGSLRMNPNSKNQGLLRPGFNVGDLDRSYTYGTPTDAPLPAIASTSAAVLIGSAVAVSPHARVIKVIVTVTAGTGSVDVKLRVNSDAYATDIFDSGSLTLGSYEFYVGGWSSPTSNSDATYLATQYGPVKAGQTPSSSNPTGDQETNLTKVDPAADSNYVGGPYNPVDFLSLAGDDVKAYSTISGSVTYKVDIIPVS